MGKRREKDHTSSATICSRLWAGHRERKTGWSCFRPLHMMYNAYGFGEISYLVLLQGQKLVR
jgi:hypothetical protein